MASSTPQSSDPDPTDPNNCGVLGYDAILKEMDARRIIIYPFKKHNLKSCSYDVTLGECYYEEQSPNTSESNLARNSTIIFNPYSKTDVHKVWGPVRMAQHARDLKKIFGGLDEIGDDEKIILLGPGKTILGHTVEFIGGRGNITAMMKARSSYGRSFIEVCKCAGWGDVGYYNRWTMEITNNSKHYTIPLITGRRLAQIVFQRVEGYGANQSIDNTKYTSAVHGSKYQIKDPLPAEFLYDDAVVAKLETLWEPSQMLPKLYTEKSY